MTPWLLQMLARLPASVHAKFLMAFLGFAGLLVTISAGGYTSGQTSSVSGNMFWLYFRLLVRERDCTKHILRVDRHQVAVTERGRTVLCALETFRDPHTVLCFWGSRSGDGAQNWSIHRTKLP